MNAQQKAVAEYLSSENVSFNARYAGETKRGDWERDAWRIAFSKVTSHEKRPGTVTIETDYFTGLGNRNPVKGAERMEGSKYNKNSIGYKQWANRYVRPVQPCAADVLYSLICDSSALDISFDCWCDDYGYDSDSISAFNTYQACCNNAKDMRRMFSHGQLEKLKELLEDY